MASTLVSFEDILVGMPARFIRWRFIRVAVHFWVQIVALELGFDVWGCVCFMVDSIIATTAWFCFGVPNWTMRSVL